MDVIPLEKAGRDLPDLIHRASGGETIVIESPSGERVRLLAVPTVDEDRVPGLLKGVISTPARLFEPLTDDELRLWYGEDD